MLEMPTNAGLPAVGDLPRISRSELEGVIRLADLNSDVIRFNPYATVLFSDDSYALPTLELAGYLADTSPSVGVKWTDTVQDCDDAAAIARGYMALNGYGNLAIGTSWFTAFDENHEVLGGHAALLGTTGFETGWWEPQTGALYPFGYAWMFPGAVSYRIDFLLF